MTDLLNSVNVKATSGVTFGTGSTLVALASSVSAGRTYTISDAGSSSANFMMDTGGVMTISGSTTVGYVLTGLTSTTANWQASTSGPTSELLTLSSSSGTQVALTLTKSYTEVTVGSGVTPLGYVFWGAKGSGTSGSNLGDCAAVDVNSNAVYITGMYSSTFTLYNSGNTAFSPSLAMVGSNINTFIAKYNDLGIVQWALSITQTGSVRGTGICVSSKTGNIYITGTYTTGTLTFNNSDATAYTTLAAATATNVFVACYNSAGFCQWVTHLSGGSSTLQQVQGNNTIAVNPNTETIYVASYTNNATTTMYNSDGTSYTTHALIGDYDCIFTCWSSTGSGIWLAAAANVSSTVVQFPVVAVNTTSGNVYFAGITGNLIYLYNNGGGNSGIYTNITTTSGPIVFIAGYNRRGNALWCARLDYSGGLVSAGSPTGICVNSLTGNVYVMANFAYGGGKVYLCNASGAQTSIVASAYTYPYTFAPLAAYNASGNALWAAVVSAGSNTPTGICVNSLTGNIYVDGIYSSSVYIINSSATLFATLSGRYGYLAAYTSAGVPFWAANNNLGFYSMCINPNNNTTFGVGYFNSSTSLYNSDGTTSSVSIANVATNDVFVCCYDNLVTNYSLPTGTVDPTQKTLLFQNNATTIGAILVIPSGTNSMYSTSGKVVYRLYFTTTGNKVALVWTNSAWTIQGNLNVPVITA